MVQQYTNNTLYITQPIHFLHLLIYLYVCTPIYSYTILLPNLLEQSETVLRIEDDVERGLLNTMEGHKSMEQLYNITKGNRSMIIKVFLLLILFIILFLIIF